MNNQERTEREICTSFKVPKVILVLKTMPIQWQLLINMTCGDRESGNDPQSTHEPNFKSEPILNYFAHSKKKIAHLIILAMYDFLRLINVQGTFICCYFARLKAELEYRCGLL